MRDLSGQTATDSVKTSASLQMGKAGGGLACNKGLLHLGDSLINHQPNYTITAWCRWDAILPQPQFLYTSSHPERLGESVFALGFSPERGLSVSAWNFGSTPDLWRGGATEPGTVPDAGWSFLAVSLVDGGIDKGTLRVNINDRRYNLTSQMIDSERTAKVDQIGQSLVKAVIDELAVFQRALSDDEITTIRELGMNGTPFGSAKTDSGPSVIPKAPLAAIAPFDAAQARQHQEAWSMHLDVPVEYTNSIGMKFVLIPPGEFSMGSTAEEIKAALKVSNADDKRWRECIQSEAPQHKVILTRPDLPGRP